MKNIHILPTDKPSRIFYIADNLYVEKGQLISPKSYRNIYITSDEDIKEGDSFIGDNVSLHKCTSNNAGNINFKGGWYSGSLNCKKVIITTDQDLIKNGIQSIDDELLEWFIKNPSCERVEIDYQTKDFINECWVYNYKIIIPKEEPKQEISIDEVGFSSTQQFTLKQETLEEAAKKHATNHGMMAYIFPEKKESFIKGVKWQQGRSYSAEEVLGILENHSSYIESFIYQYIDKNDMEDDEKWFEQFKKK